MEQTYFNNDPFKYDEYMKNKCDNNNISTLLYASSNNFDLKGFLFEKDLIEQHKFSEKEVVFILNPDIAKLSEAFEYICPVTYEENNLLHCKSEELTIKLDISLMLNKVTEFIKKRNYAFSSCDFSHITNFDKNVQKEINEALCYLLNLMPPKELTINDWFEHQNIMIKRGYFEKVQYIHNYEMLRNLLVSYCLNPSEYFECNIGLSKLKKEKVLLQKKLKTVSVDEQKIIIDKINDCEMKIREYHNTISIVNEIPSFNQETISKFCLFLESYVEKEKALNNFIFAVRNNKTSTVTIEDKKIINNFRY